MHNIYIYIYIYYINILLYNIHHMTCIIFYFIYILLYIHAVPDRVSIDFGHSPFLILCLAQVSLGLWATHQSWRESEPNAPWLVEMARWWVAAKKLEFSPQCELVPCQIGQCLGNLRNHETWPSLGTGGFFGVARLPGRCCPFDSHRRSGMHRAKESDEREVINLTNWAIKNG